MVNGFIYSAEGEAEYSELDMSYPKEVFDQLYDDYIKNTTAEDLDKYTHHKTQEIVGIKRIKAGDGKEYLTYSMTEYRLDQALNVKHWFRPDVGKFPIPKAIYTIKQVAFGKQVREISDIASIDTGYSIPFSKEKMNELRDEIGFTQQQGQQKQKVQFSVQHPNGIRISVETFEDLRDGEYNELSHFGRIPSDVQRQRWIAENGILKDEERLALALRQKTEGDLPQKSVTAEIVKDMISSALNDSKSSSSSSTTDVQHRPDLPDVPKKKRTLKKG